MPTPTRAPFLDEQLSPYTAMALAKVLEVADPILKVGEAIPPNVGMGAPMGFAGLRILKPTAEAAAKIAPKAFGRGVRAQGRELMQYLRKQRPQGVPVDVAPPYTTGSVALLGNDPLISMDLGQLRQLGVTQGQGLAHELSHVTEAQLPARVQAALTRADEGLSSVGMRLRSQSMVPDPVRLQAPPGELLPRIREGGMGRLFEDVNLDPDARKAMLGLSRIMRGAIRAKEREGFNQIRP